MKPATAAKKLDVYLPATPAEFQQNTITRGELAALQEDPPQWLQDLRKNGPHPKNLVAAKLGVSIAGLTRGGATEALTTEQINALLEEKPDWLVAERESFQAVLTEERRVKALQADKPRKN
jgi:Trp operon repressor